jgi:hypothetical protein
MPTTKAIFERFALTDTGDTIPGAEYTVVNEITGTALTIFSSREGAAKSPPYFADSTGLIQFWVNAGTTFRVAVTGPTGTFTSRWNQGLLLQESPTDASNGRVLTTGAFGLGAMDTPLNNSISAFLPAGFYQTSAGATDFPVVNSSRLVFGRSSTRRAELYIGTELASPPTRAWVRGGDPSVAAFRELYHTGNLIYAQNTSGATVNSNSTVSGANLTPAQTGTWRNVSGSNIANNGYGQWAIVL